MVLDQLAQIGEFVGGVFVVVSLAYIAHQVRQATQSLRTENYARVLDRWQGAIGWWLSHPGIREWWVTKPAPFSADFQAFCDDVIRTHRMDPVVLGRWHRFVAGEASVVIPGAGS